MIPLKCVIKYSFVRLKSLIENDKKLGKNNEIDYIIEFILSKNIDRKYIEHQYINNFYTKLLVTYSRNVWHAYCYIHAVAL